MMDMESTNTAEKYPSHLKYQPLKDTLLIVSAVLIIVLVSLISFLAKPKSDNTCVEIKYQDHLLFDIDDRSKSTSVSFPSNGEKRLTFHKEDAPLYIPGLSSFGFLSDSLTITLYSDRSIEIKKEDITCPNHDCSKTGRVYQTYTPIVCLPNQIQVTIVNQQYPEFVN